MLICANNDCLSSEIKWATPILHSIHTMVWIRNPCEAEGEHKLMKPESKGLAEVMRPTWLPAFIQSILPRIVVKDDEE